MFTTTISPRLTTTFITVAATTITTATDANKPATTTKPFTKTST